MAQTIQIKNGTGSSSPATLAQGELAINVSSGSLWYGSGSSNVTHSSFHISELTCSAMLDSNGNYAPGSGNISASGNIYATQYYVDGKLAIDYAGTSITYGQNNQDAFIRGNTIALGTDATQHITASGNISSSGNIYAEKIYSDGAYYSKGYGVLGTDGVTTTVAKTGLKTHIDGTNIYLDGPVTASGHISASGNIYGKLLQLQGRQFGHIINDTINLGYEIETPIKIGKLNNPITLAGNITASGHISASKNLSASSSLYIDGFPLIACTDTAFVLDGGGKYTSYGLGRGNQVKSFSVFGHITASSDISSSGTLSGLIVDIPSADSLTIAGELATAAIVWPVATVATNVTGLPTTDNTDFFLGITEGQNGSQVVESSTKLKFNPSTGGLTVNGTGSFSHVTSSGEISASGNIYSNNTKVIASSFQLLNNMAADTWYGPNQQGPSYYYWNKVYPDKPTLTYWNSGYHLPCKAELISVRMVLTNFSSGTDTTFTTKCQILPSPTWPLDDVDDVNDPILETAEYSVTALLRFGGYEATGPLSGSYDAGTIIYPRIKSNVGSINSRGHYEIRYREII